MPFSNYTRSSTHLSLRVSDHPLCLSDYSDLTHCPICQCVLCLLMLSLTLSAARLSISVSAQIIARSVRRRTLLTSSHLSDLCSARSLFLPSPNHMWHLIFTCWMMDSSWLITTLSPAPQKDSLDTHVDKSQRNVLAAAPSAWLSLT